VCLTAARSGIHSTIIKNYGNVKLKISNVLNKISEKKKKKPNPTLLVVAKKRG
jgi:formyltetrahydrofolate synthetase